jgi:hypothetical protein
MNARRCNQNMSELADVVNGMVQMVFGYDAHTVLMVLHDPTPDDPKSGTRIEFRTTMCEHHTAHTLAEMARQYAERHEIQITDAPPADDCCESRQ